MFFSKMYGRIEKLSWARSSILYYIFAYIALLDITSSLRIFNLDLLHFHKIELE